VSISGAVILVGAPRALSSIGAVTGAAYTFEQSINASTGAASWEETAKFLDDVNASGQCFGSSVQSTGEGLLMFAAVPAQVLLEVGSSDDQDDTAPDDQLSAQVFTFVPASLKKAESGKQQKSSSSPAQQFLFPLIVTIACVLTVIPLTMLAVHLYRARVLAAGGPAQPLDEQREEADRGAPVLRVSPLQATGVGAKPAISIIDVETGGVQGHSSSDGESPAGTPQAAGSRRKETRSGVYTEIGVSEYNGSSIWSSVKSVFVTASPPGSDSSAAAMGSPLQQEPHAKKNPMMLRRDTAVVNS
jgi:hypothetical protein